MAHGAARLRYWSYCQPSWVTDVSSEIFDVSAGASSGGASSRSTKVEYSFPSAHSTSPTPIDCQRGSTGAGSDAQPAQIWSEAASLRAVQSLMPGSRTADPTNSCSEVAGSMPRYVGTRSAEGAAAPAAHIS